MKDKFLKIINHYGVMPQLKYFQSEVFELNEAIIKNEYDEYKDIKENIDHILEEIADVLVMLNQFIRYYDINIDELNEMVEFKVNRTLQRMEDEKK